MVIGPQTNIPLVPDVHVIAPPGPNEREGKKRLKNTKVGKWNKIMEKLGGGYLEYDDFVVALYKALPYNVRRWRGRDGVWRDRDIRSDTRIARLYEVLGSAVGGDQGLGFDLDAAIDYAWEAVHNLSTQEAQDRIIGKIGQAMAAQAEALGKKGYWAGSGGFQRGGALTRKQWEKMKEALAKEQAKKYMRNRWYKVWEYGDEGEWKLVSKLRPVTQIPWYRQESAYQPRITQDNINSGLYPRPRYYYDEAWTPRENPKIEIGST